MWVGGPQCTELELESFKPGTPDTCPAYLFSANTEIIGLKKKLQARSGKCYCPCSGLSVHSVVVTFSTDSVKRAAFEVAAPENEQFYFIIKRKEMGMFSPVEKITRGRF